MAERLEERLLLKEVQLRLGVPQHVLIHLCEKGVVEPDYAETSGRGKRREFSERNLFEFAVSMALRDAELPVSSTALIIRILRHFERALSKRSRAFQIPDFLLQTGTDLRLYIDDGARLTLVIESAAVAEGSLRLGATLPSKASPSSIPRVQRLSALPTDYDTRLEVNLTRIARRIFQ